MRLYTVAGFNSKESESSAKIINLEICWKNHKKSFNFVSPEKWEPQVLLAFINDKYSCRREEFVWTIIDTSVSTCYCKALCRVTKLKTKLHATSKFLHMF